MCWARGVLIVLWGASLAQSDDLAEQLRKLDPNVIAVEGADAATKDRLRQMLANDVRERLREANRRETEAWRKIRTREEWGKYRDERIEALRNSLGYSWVESPRVVDPVPTRRPKNLELPVTQTIDGDGFQIENILFTSRSGLLVTGNLYVPKPGRDSMPGILICPSHHNPKTQGELQDMGMTWARAGCLVLVIDNLGHGERRQHLFRTKGDYRGEFQIGRQDYYFRYNLGMQLHLVGESLIGYMAHDLMSGVDLLLSRGGIDKNRIILLGSVAGGGDPAGVTAAMDSRISCVVPFNFGGPQPETKYPLPDNVDESFNYVGGGSWESTRNLRLSARDGFLPWVIVGSVAPRKLIHAHEFSWDREHDPVWKRYQTIFGFYEAAENLSFTHGHGLLSGQPPEASHCNNIGAPHRKLIYKAFQQWFGIKEPAEEYSARRLPDELICYRHGSLMEQLEGLTRVARGLSIGPLERARAKFNSLSIPERKKELRRAWENVLGNIGADEDIRIGEHKTIELESIRIERIELAIEHGISVPMLLMIPPVHKSRTRPLVVAVAQGGKAGFLQNRAEILAALLTAGVCVCLPDVRGTGETRTGDDRGRRSSATAISSSYLMLGQPLMGSQLKDLRTVLSYLRTRQEFLNQRISLWGDSFAEFNVEEEDVKVPLDAQKIPKISEPLGHVLSLLAGVFDEDLAAIASVRGGLAGFESVLDGPFCHLPHDVISPGALTCGDLADLAVAIAPRPLWISELVDGTNQQLSPEWFQKGTELVNKTYREQRALPNLVLKPNRDPDARFVGWLTRNLRN